MLSCSVSESSVFPRNLGFTTYGRRGLAIHFRWAFWHWAITSRHSQYFLTERSNPQKLFSLQRAPPTEVCLKASHPLVPPADWCKTSVICQCCSSAPQTDPEYFHLSQLHTVEAICALGLRAEPLSSHQAQCFKALQTGIAQSCTEQPKCSVPAGPYCSVV